MTQSRVKDVCSFFSPRNQRPVVLIGCYRLSGAVPRYWGRSSVGRASALQAECRRFDSVRLHQKQGLLAQLVRASP